MTRLRNAPRTLCDTDLDDIHGGAAGGIVDPGKRMLPDDDLPVLAWQTDDLSTSETPVSKPDTR